MLSTFTSPISSRRGGQPGNNNARTHGLYARRRPSPALQQFTAIKRLQQSAIFASRSRQLGLAELQVQTLQELLIDNFLDASDAHLGPHTLVKIERFYRTVSATLRAKRALKQLYDELDFLPSLARNALSLCTAEFTDRRISPYAYYGQANELFVPQLLQKNRAVSPNAANHYPLSTTNWFHLTASQWTLLEPIMTSLRIHLAEMGIRPRTRVYSDRFLIECILTRLAFGLSWDELRGQIPVRACQLLYKQLCTSGRMRLIYEVLHNHLLSEGRVTLLAMAQDGSFGHTADRVLLSGGDLPSWQHLAALLLLQRALYNRRRIKRAESQARRRQGRYERTPSISRQRSSRRQPIDRFQHQAPQPVPGLISISDCRSTNPLLSEKLRSISGSSP